MFGYFPNRNNNYIIVFYLNNNIKNRIIEYNITLIQIA